MAEQGYIVISDITGYTAFLSGSELDHAQDSLHSLLEVLIQHAEPPLVISRLEGDAVISYAPSGSFLQGQTLVELLENTYAAFRQARQRMQLNTTCACNACKNIPNLDLKFFVHYGSFVVDDLGTHPELVGSDVNLIHRLLKNEISQTTGIYAYAAYTEAAVNMLGIHDFSDEMIPHTENYDHLGDVRLYVQDMQPVWERERKRRRVFVDPGDALFTLEIELPAPAPLVWDFVTMPEYRQTFLGADSMEVTNRLQGRTTNGTVFYCAHGEARIPQTVVDWRPFDYYTYHSETPYPEIKAMVSVRLVPEVEGTRVMVICGQPEGPRLKRLRAKRALKVLGPAGTQQGLEALRDRVVQDLERGEAVRVEPTRVSPEQVAAAVESSLAG